MSYQKGQAKWLLTMDRPVSPQKQHFWLQLHKFPIVLQKQIPGFYKPVNEVILLVDMSTLPPRLL